MGYRSDVRIVTSKKGFNELNKYVKNYLKDRPDYNLMEDLKFKVENKYSTYFGWDYIKWYEGYDSVDAITNGLKHLADKDMSYRFARMGESYDDFEEDSYESENEEEQDLDYPSMIREFDDDYVIDGMKRIDSLEEQDKNGPDI